MPRLFYWQKPYQSRTIVHTEKHRPHIASNNVVQRGTQADKGASMTTDYTPVYMPTSLLAGREVLQR